MLTNEENEEPVDLTKWIREARENEAKSSSAAQTAAADASLRDRGGIFYLGGGTTGCSTY